MNKRIPRSYDEWVDPPHLGMSGQAGYVSADAAEEDVVERLRLVVEEVTGRPVERQTKRIGFI